MTDKSAEQLLIELANAQAALEAIHRAWMSASDTAMPEEVKQVLQEINDEYRPQVEHAEMVVKELEASAKEAVIKEGKTVKTLRLQAVFTSPKALWDNAKLEGYAASNPEVLTLRTFSKPSVSIRAINGKKE